MATLHIEAELSPEELLTAVQQLSPAELDVFTAKVLALRAARVAPSLPAAEAVLLQQINTPVPPGMQNRFDALRRRLDGGTLSDAEQGEYRQRIEQIERWDADRLEWLGELARLRQKPLRTLIAELGLAPHDYKV